MRPIELDPRFTFAAFVIGATNRLAVAAARQVAEAPGTRYMPLLIHGASGLGKTHLATAIGHHARGILPNLPVHYSTLEQFVGQMQDASGAGGRESFRARLDEIRLLLLDDVQFLAGQSGMQEELLRAWEVIAKNGGQLVLTSDRPPREIAGLGDRFLSRLSGGLIVDIGMPDYETRLAISRHQAKARGQTLEAGVAEALARIAFGNVRELQGSLNRLLAIQELEGRAVVADEVAQLLGRMANSTQLDEFGSFLAEITDTLDAVVANSAAEPGHREQPGDLDQPAEAGSSLVDMGDEDQSLPASAPASGPGTVDDASATKTEKAAQTERLDPWFLDREKVVWTWPYIEECIVQEWE